MNKLLSLSQNHLSNKTHSLLLLVFLSLLGSHFLENYLYIFIILGLFLVNWTNLFHKNILLIMLFFASVYISWIFLDPRLLHQWYLAKEVFLPGILILLMYLLGFSIRTEQKDGIQFSSRNIFYLLFIFVITYSFFVLWSYFTITQDNPLSGIGMYVCFPNPYQQAHINGGRLISTILTYYLTLMTFMLPLIVFYFNKLKKQGFYTVELLLLVGLSLFVLYITAIMGRRVVFVLFTLVCLFLFLTYIIHYKKIKKVLFSLALLVTLFYGINSYMQEQNNTSQLKAIVVTDDFMVPIVQSTKKQTFNLDTISVFNKLTHRGLKDQRFSWWEKSFHVMLEHPFGGGNGIYLAPGIKLTHNVWLDMGKDLGIIPFTLLLIITLLHLYYLIRIFFSKQIEYLLKYQLVILAIGLFAIMMIEPVFNSDKTFFAYIFFYFGILGKLHVEITKRKFIK